MVVLSTILYRKEIKVIYRALPTLDYTKFLFCIIAYAKKIVPLHMSHRRIY